ncbi:MAG: hypothetical protein ACPIOQ_32410, partial [Promethearchaeia archaeon]
ADVCDDLLSPRGQGVVATAAGGGALAAMRRASFRGSAVNVAGAGAGGPRVRVEQESRLPLESLHLLSRHAAGRV